MSGLLALTGPTTLLPKTKAGAMLLIFATDDGREHTLLFVTLRSRVVEAPQHCLLSERHVGAWSIWTSDGHEIMLNLA